MIVFYDRSRLKKFKTVEARGDCPIPLTPMLSGPGHNGDKPLNISKSPSQSLQALTQPSDKAAGLHIFLRALPIFCFFFFLLSMFFFLSRPIFPSLIPTKWGVPKSSLPPLIYASVSVPRSEWLAGASVSVGPTAASGASTGDG